MKRQSAQQKDVRTLDPRSLLHRFLSIAQVDSFMNKRKH